MHPFILLSFALVIFSFFLFLPSLSLPPIYLSIYLSIYLFISYFLSLSATLPLSIYPSISFSLFVISYSISSYLNQHPIYSEAKLLLISNIHTFGLLSFDDNGLLLLPISYQTFANISFYLKNARSLLLPLLWINSSKLYP